MNPHAEPSDALAAYVDALLQISGQLTAILHHMWQHENPDAQKDPYDTLAELVEGTIPRRISKREADLENATQLIATTSEVIASEIFLVADDAPLDEPPMNGSERLH